MQYDMAYKRASRLAGRSWAEIQIEAHKLAALGLETAFTQNTIDLRRQGTTLVRIASNGEIYFHKPNTFGWYLGDIDAVAQALRDLLVQRQEQAATLAGVAGAMKQAAEEAQS